MEADMQQICSRFRYLLLPHPTVVRLLNQLVHHRGAVVVAARVRRDAWRELEKNVSTTCHEKKDMFERTTRRES